MEFSKKLNEYIEQINCTSKELADASNISSALISKYRSGSRKPSLKSGNFINLVNGLYNLGKDKKIENWNLNNIQESLENILNSNQVDSNILAKNFNEIITLFNVNISKLSRSLSFDASYISRIRTGKRTPANQLDFINNVSKYITKHYYSEDNLKVLSNLLNCEINDIKDKKEFFYRLNNWMSSNTKSSSNNIDSFLARMDNFNLSEYIKVIHFDELKVPSIPFLLPKSKNYYGIDEMKNAELDFFKYTVLSKNNNPIFMYSNMPMEDMAKDIDFGKKWMFAIAMSLKKGLTLNMIHNLDRPFSELLIGLESWIPIYMTGQISPYYLTETQSNTFRHLDYVSGNVALCGECISTHHNNGKYYLTTNKEELKYYSKKAEDILSKAKPLMKIFEKENQDTYNANLVAESKIIGERHNILSALPIYTLTRDLLDKILSFNKVSTNDKELILNFYEDELKIINTILSHSKIIDEFSELNKKEFSEIKPILSLSGLFYEKKIYYSYEQYKEHIELIKQINKKNYKAIINNNLSFKNIQIFIREEKWVMISKNDNPTIHFIITHPKLCNAIENFAAPIIE